MRIVLLLLSCLLISCGPSPQRGVFHAFGTEVTVDIGDVTHERAEELFEALNDQLQGMHRHWHAWQDSELTQITQACHSGKPLTISDSLAYLIREGALLEKESQGYFNPAIGEVIDLWGFLSHQSTETRSAPSPEALAAALAAHPSMQDLVLQGNVLHCHNPHLRLDLGAYAKGYGVGLMMNYLKSQGIQRALINAGGDLMILQGPKSTPKRIGIQSPDPFHPYEVLSIDESTSVFTSGTYARVFTESNTQRSFHHLINPKTGLPSTDFISVTVIHPDPMRADAAATAILAANKADAPAVAAGLGIDKYLLITAEGERIKTPAMQAYLVPKKDAK
jgi:thiamine biosynthesis lipoprotein